MSDYDKMWTGIRDNIMGVVEERAKSLLDKNAAARELIKERATRLAKLTATYIASTDDGQKQALAIDMDIVKRTIENEIAVMALDASAESRTLFQQVAGAVFNTVIRVLPGAFGAL